MEPDQRCTKCYGPLNEGEQECPWCGFDPQRQKGDGSLSFTTVLVMVAVLGLLSIVLVYQVATYEPPPPYYHTSYNFAKPLITNRTVDDGVVWDATMKVNKVTPRDELHAFSRIQITIEDTNRNVLDRNVKLRPYDETALDDGSDGTVDVQAWYIDDVEHPKKLSPGDQIIITGMTKDYEGCLIIMDIQDNYMAASTVFLRGFE